MSYRRIETQDGKTVMNKELYDNLQDGIEEALEKGSVTTECTTIEEFVLTEEATTIKKGVTVLIGEVQYILVAEDGTNANNYIAVGATPDNIVLSEDYTDPEVAQEEFNGFPEREDVIGNYEATIANLREQNQLLRDNMCNPNLLDNPWFTVNQRGQTEYTEADSYTVDRWKISKAGTSITINENGCLKITNNSQSINFIMNIYDYTSFPIYKLYKGKPLTLSVMLEDGTVISNTSVVGDKPSITANIVTRFSICDGVSFAISYNPNSNTVYAQFNIDAGKSITIKATKLELGDYSTLAMDTAPNYALELIKCSMATGDLSDTYANKTLTFN